MFGCALCCKLVIVTTPFTPMKRRSLAVVLSPMQSCFPARLLGPPGAKKFVAVALAALFAGGCSRSEVQVMAPPPPPPPAWVTALPSVAPIRQTASERLVEIDRLLAAPVTGLSEDSDRRTLLRAERAALVDSGQVSYRAQSQFAVNRNRTAQPNAPPATVTSRAANGDIINYAPATTQTGRTVVAPNSQASNLPYLEQMTPTERAHYYKELRLRNANRIEVDVHHHH